MTRSFFYLFILVFTFSSAWSLAASLPSHDKEGRVVLTKDTKEAFKNLPYRSMTPLNRDDFSNDVLSLYKKNEKASPSLLFGDFNGDDAQDAVLLLRAKKEVVAVILLQNQSSLKVIELGRWKPNPESKLEVTYLSLLPEKEVKFAGKEVKKPRDLIQVETYLGEVKAYYLDDNKVHSYKGVVP